MGVISARQLNEALQQAKAVGLVEEKFTLGECEVVVRNLRPDEYESVVQECKDLEDLVYLNNWQEGHICRAIVEINGVDLRTTEFVEVEEPDPKNKQATRTVKRELHDWIRKNILSTWSKEAIFTAFRKFTDAVQLAENKAKEGVTFIVAEESSEEKFRRLLGEVKEMESEVPPHILKAALEENGYTFFTAPQDQEALRDFDQKMSGGSPPPEESPQTSPQASPVAAAPPPQPAPSRGPAPEKVDPIQQVASIMRQRVPLNQQPGIIPDMPKAPIVVQEPATAAPQAVTPPVAVARAAAVPVGKIPLEVDNITEALRAAPPQAVLPPGVAPPPDALPGTFAAPADRAPAVLSQRGQQHVDPRGLASILEQNPTAGINPKFRPQR